MDQFLDTGSIPVSSTKKEKRHLACRFFLFSFGGTDEELNPSPRQTSAVNFCSAYAEGEFAVLPQANATLPFCKSQGKLRRSPQCETIWRALGSNDRQSERCICTPRSFLLVELTMN